MHSEVGASSGLDPVGLLPEVDVVEVRSEDAVLAPLLVELDGEAALGELPAERLLRAEVEVAHELLLDRRRALCEPARRDVALQRSDDPEVVDAAVLVEAAVLDGDDRLPHHRTDPPQRDGLAVAARTEQSQMSAVAVEEDARPSGPVRLEAVEAARVPEERSGDCGTDGERAHEDDDAGGRNLQPPLQARPSVRRVPFPMGNVG